MRIGIVCYPTFGGSGVLATELGKALAQKDHQVHFITYQQPVRLNGFIPNIFYHEVQVPTYPLFDYPPYETALASTMVDVIRNNNLDLLHVHYAIPHASAAYLAKQILKKENKNIEAVLNNDIMGSNNSSETNIIDNTRIRVFSEGLPFYELDKNAANIRQLGLENDGKARQLARYVKETGERYVDNLQVVMVYRNDRFLRGGDHTPYVMNGYAAVRITEMNENYNHQHQDIRKENGIQYGDLTEFMDFEYLRKNTALNLCNLANLAKAPAMPQDVKVDVKKLDNYTVLSWGNPKSGKTKGFYVLMRETTSAVWQRKIFTTQTNISLPYSKDNYFFAVQSVSEDGNESLPVVPVVGR